MKYLTIIPLFFISFFSLADFEQLICQNFSESKRPLFKSSSGSLVIFGTKNRSGSCTFEFKNPNETSSSRRFYFRDNGLFQVVANFKDKNQSTSLSRTSGTKGYYFYPKSGEQEVLVDKKTGEIKLITVTGEEIFFDPKSGNIDEDKTTDLMIKQRPVSQNSGTAITVASPSGLLINFGYRQGGANQDSPMKELLVEDDLGNYCRIKANKLFNYEVKCKEKSKSCDCDGNYFKSCTLEYEKIRGEYSFKSGRLDVNGVEPKFGSTREMDEYIVSMCPELSVAVDKYRDQITPVIVDAPKFKSDENYRAPGIVNPIDLRGATIVEEDLSPRPIQIANATEQVNRAPALINEEQELALQSHFNMLEKERQLQDIFDSEIGLDLSQSVDEGITVNCKEELVNYFNDKENKEELGEYLKTQGKITLHRLAWTYLKLSEDNTDSIEKTIKDLLLKRNPKLHGEFIKRKLKTRNERLLSVMSELKSAGEEVSKKDDYPYTLKYGDLKMVELLVAAEKKLGRSYKKGVMDYISIISNSYKNRLKKKDKNQDVAKKIVDGLIVKSKKFENKIENYLSSKNCKFESQFLGCGAKEEEKFNISKALQESSEIVDAVYEKQFEKESEISHNFKWNTYWLHVK